MLSRSRSPLVWMAGAVVLIALGAGGGWLKHQRSVETQANATTGGVAAHAVPVMLANGCAGCHTISGVPSATGLVGPALDKSFALKTHLGGRLPNTPTNLIHWLRASREIDPDTAMPSTGISEQQARDVAAYLYALK